MADRLFIARFIVTTLYYLPTHTQLPWTGPFLHLHCVPRLFTTVYTHHAVTVDAGWDGLVPPHPHSCLLPLFCGSFYTHYHITVGYGLHTPDFIYLRLFTRQPSLRLPDDLFTVTVLLYLYRSWLGSPLPIPTTLPSSLVG